MKDYFDLLMLVREGALDRKTLAQAIAATFKRRGTPLPAEIPLGLSAEFAQDAQKRAQWAAFLTRNRLTAPALADTIDEISAYLRAILDRARKQK